MYTNDDPVNRHDPTGLCGEDEDDFDDRCMDNDGSGGGGADLFAASAGGGLAACISVAEGLTEGELACLSAFAPELPAPTAQPCTSETAKIDTTLTNLEDDILSITKARDPAAAPDIAALTRTLSQDVSAEEQDPLAFFVGGHFDLDVSLDAIAGDLGGFGTPADTRFLQLFEGKTFDGVRQGPVTTTDPGHSYWLHSKPAGLNLDFHFDRYNVWKFPKGTLLHGAVDYLWGHLGTHCLDPAWRNW
jgi:hypothetical protein